MKCDTSGLRTIAGKLGRRAGGLYKKWLKAPVLRLVSLVRTEIIDYRSMKERNRRIILLLASLFVLDYLMYCFHTDKNIVDIFPEIVPLEQMKTVSVYLPDTDGETMIAERRSIPRYDSDDKTARALFEVVVKGSIFDNTSMAVPAGLFLRKVWLLGNPEGKNRTCIFDLEPVEVGTRMSVVKNSEALFRRALEKTVIENIPSVGTVMLLEKGVPGTPLWEL